MPRSTCASHTARCGELGCVGLLHCSAGKAGRGVVIGAMVIDRVRVAVSAGLAESVTFTVKVHVPAALGVPANAPAVEKVTPGGSDPDAIDQWKADLPPAVTALPL